MKNFNELPASIQNEVKNLLKIYDKCFVTYENAAYHVSPSIAITASYAVDHEVIGTYTAKEIYTAEERIINYVESFHEFPIQYKGKRDYRWLNSLAWGSKVKLENGNLVNA